MRMTAVVFIVFVMTIVVLAALLGMALVRRFVPRDRLARHTEVAGYLYAVIGVIYGVILAQVVVAAWEEYRDARTISGAEASSVLNLDRLSRVWPEADRQRIHAALASYARDVVEVEWPAMAAGDFSAVQDSSRINAIWAAYDHVARSDQGASANYAQSLTQLDTVDESRRARYQLGARTLPQTMTITLVVGGIVTVGFSYLFAIENRWIHAVMTTSLAVLIALLLLLEYELETPFSGLDAITPAAMEVALATLNATP